MNQGPKWVLIKKNTVDNFMRLPLYISPVLYKVLSPLSSKVLSLLSSKVLSPLSSTRFYLPCPLQGSISPVFYKILSPLSSTRFFLPWPLLFSPHGHIATLFSSGALYPEPRTRLYEIPIYLYRSSLWELNCWSVQAYKTPNSCGEGLLGNLFRVRPIPTGYSLYALNPLLPGLEPGPAQSTLTELHCWC